MPRKVARDSSIHEIKIVRKAPVITHIFFVDDNLLFSMVTAKEADCIMSVLKKYQEASVQVVNLEKFEASLSCNMNEDDINLIQ